jgi:hypothetical protein
MGKMADMMAGGPRKPQPRLHISAHVDDYDIAGEMPFDDTKYLRKDLARVKGTIKKIESELATFVPEDVAEKVRKSLEAQLASEKDRVAELRLQIKHAKKRARR